MQNLTITCPECGKNTVIDGKCMSCGAILWEVDKSKLKQIESKSEPEPKGPVADFCPFCKKQTLINGFCRECGFEEESGTSREDTPVDEDESTDKSNSTKSNGFSVLAFIIAILLIGWGLTKIFNVEIFVGCVALK